MTAEQQAMFDANIKVWQDRAEQGLVRLGEKWVADAVASQARQEAAQLFRQAFEMIKVLNFAEARRTLERASRVDPNSIAPDFTLGLLNSITPPNFRNPKTAEKHFQTVLRRLPGYVPALNNLAIAQIRQEKYADAVRNLRLAAEHSPDAAEVTQNLGRFISETRLGRLRPRKTVLADATKIYSNVVVAKEGVPSELRFGWRFIPLVPPAGERESLAGFQTPETGIEGQGTGFVVEPHYVITCRHVVDDHQLGRADKIELIDPEDPKHQRRLSAICVAVSDDDDLCLLRCEQMNAPSVALADYVPPRGTEVVLIGFPGGSGFGLGLKMTRGVVTALLGDVARIGGLRRWLDFSRKLWYDAKSSHGASGGAVCDDRANVVAIHAVGYQPDNDPSNARYAGGVPATLARAFVRKSVPTFAHPPAQAGPLKWTDVDAQVAPSVVLIVVSYRRAPIAMNSQGRSALHVAEDIYNDRMCSACNGTGRMACHAPGCQHGTVYGEITVSNPTVVGRTARSDIVIDNPLTHTTRQACPTCGGKGVVHCPFCSGGVDPNLL